LFAVFVSGSDSSIKHKFNVTSYDYSNVVNNITDGFCDELRYELHEKGLLLTDDPQVVTDVYSKNEALELQVQHFRDESEKFKDAAM